MTRRDRGQEEREQVTELVGTSYEMLAAGYPLTWPVPFGDRPGGDAFEFHWHLIQYVFRLPDPTTFPPLGKHVSETGSPVLRRYIAAASELADSQFLRHPIRMSYAWNTEKNTQEITTEYPPSENVRGFSVMFRQFYSRQEPASFDAVQGILRTANVSADDQASATRTAQLDIWGKAIRRLKAYQLKVLVGHRLKGEGRWWGEDLLPNEDESPSKVIDMYNYGEDIHWGEKERRALAAYESDPFWSANQRMNFFESVGGLAQVFLGFSVLVDSALANG